MTQIAADPPAATALREKIAQTEARVGIIGMGYVGLPLLRSFCQAGHRCLAYDLDSRKVRALNRGTSYIKHIPSATLKGLLRRKLYEASDKPSDLRRCDAISVCRFWHHRRPSNSCVRGRPCHRSRVADFDSLAAPGC